MRSAALIVLLATGALIPWAGLFVLLRAGIRLARPQLRARPGKVAIVVPGRPWAGTALILAAFVVVGGWAMLAEPLCGGYAADAISYRGHGRAAALAIRQELEAAGQTASSGSLGPGNLVYTASSPNVSTEAVFSYHWRGAPQIPLPDSPVGLITVAADHGVYGLTYRLAIEAGRLDQLRALLQRASATGADHSAQRALATDLRLLVGSVMEYWQGFFGYLDNPSGFGRFLIGLPALLPMTMVGVAVAIVP